MTIAPTHALDALSTTFFVLEEGFDRYCGPTQRRYSCSIHNLIKAQSLRCDEIRTDDQDKLIDEFLNNKGPSSNFLCAVINSKVDFGSLLMETGKGGIVEDEIEFAFGVTKELTYEAYAEINRHDESGWD